MEVQMELQKTHLRKAQTAVQITAAVKKSQQQQKDGSTENTDTSADGTTENADGSTEGTDENTDASTEDTLNTETLTEEGKAKFEQAQQFCKGEYEGDLADTSERCIECDRNFR